MAGEHSGDALGAKLMAALNERRRGRIRYVGVGGEQMAQQGLVSQFPLQDVAVMGIGAILGRLPTILRRVYGTAAAVVAAEPDALVIIDSPEFTHPIARRVRRRLPEVPIIDYVSPSVWAWRPGRARKMRNYVDHVLALLPFEPDAHHRLGGPPCTYVGHPLIERMDWISALDTAPLAERLALPADSALLLVLPGSRPSEVSRLMQPFGETLTRLMERGRKFEVVIPVVESVRGLIERQLPAWPKQPHLVTGEEDKFRAFKLARAALAASGTVTLELAVAGTPMVVAYKVDPLMAPALRLMIKRRPSCCQTSCSTRRRSRSSSRRLARPPIWPMRSPRCSTKARRGNGSWRRWPGFPSACSCRRERPARRPPMSCSTTPRRAAAGPTRSLWDGIAEGPSWRLGAPNEPMLMRRARRSLEPHSICSDRSGLLPIPGGTRPREDRGGKPVPKGVRCPHRFSASSSGLAEFVSHQ